MALEDLIAEQNTLLKQLNAQFAQVIAAQAGATVTQVVEAPAATTEEKPKTTKATKAKAEPAAPVEEKAEEPAAPAVTVETLDAKIRPWFAEFDKEHVETKARKAKFKERLGKLGAAKMSEITDQEKLDALNTWFEKIKIHDFGHGAGLVAAPPVPVEEGADEDDL